MSDISALTDRYINPLTDFGFKRIFGTELNKQILIDFLNVVLPPTHQILDLTYSNPENLGNTPVDRKAVFDLYCESESGDKFIVEMQFNDHKHDPALLHIVELKDQECRVFYDKLKFIYIELPKFTKTIDELPSSPQQNESPTKIA